MKFCIKIVGKQEEEIKTKYYEKGERYEGVMKDDKKEGKGMYLQFLVIEKYKFQNKIDHHK